MNLSELNSFEDGLAAKFRKHSVFTAMGDMSKNAIRTLLLQRRFHSLIFTPVYDVAIDGLSDPPAVKIARKILREEYPPEAPSHRELLMRDLLAIGISRKKILHTVPTRATRQSIEALFSLLSMEEYGLHEVKLIAVLRFFGEILVAEEYFCLMPGLARLGLTQNQSRFYWPHYLHDRKRRGLHNTAVEKGTHADQLTAVLQNALRGDEKKIAFCAHIEKRVYEIKCAFYDQFSSLV